MGSTLPIIEVVIFHANEKCLGDLALFKEVRDMVAATTRCVQPGFSDLLASRDPTFTTRMNPSVKAMYWGPCVELPKVMVWLLGE
jgi:hypothetical protein